MRWFCGTVKMAERVAITDEDSAKAWLETQDHQTQVWFATRSALRALPGLGTWGDATTSGLAFAVCRMTLISAAMAALRQSTLKKTFSGHLVPHDPNDEPASALIERIKANRAKAHKVKRRRISA